MCIFCGFLSLFSFAEKSAKGLRNAQPTAEGEVSSLYLLHLLEVDLVLHHIQLSRRKVRIKRFRDNEYEQRNGKYRKHDVSDWNRSGSEKHFCLEIFLRGISDYSTVFSGRGICDPQRLSAVIHVPDDIIFLYQNTICFYPA